MTALFEISIGNVAAALLLALVAWVVSRWCRKPAVNCGLWVLVLLKLVTPPLFTIPLEVAGSPPAERVDVVSAAVPAADADRYNLVIAETEPLLPESEPPLDALLPIDATGEVSLPAPEDLMPVAGDAAFALEPRTSPAQAHSVAAPSVGDVAQLSGEVSQESFDSGNAAILPHLVALLSLVWFAGAAGVLLVTLWRIVRFQRLLRAQSTESITLQREVESLAAEMGLRSAPLVALLPSKLSPLLWPIGRRARILFPQGLLSRLDDEGRRSLLLHELSHLRRRDHWVRFLELIVTSLYWWNPVVWWARREIERWEEECCDACVVAHMPHGRRTYATALLETLEFLSEPRQAWPAVASGVARLQSVRTRLSGILRADRAGNLSGANRWMLGLVALVALTLGPALAQPDSSASETPADKTAQQTEPVAADPPATPPPSRETSEPLFTGLVGIGEPIEFATQPTALQFAPRYAWSSPFSLDEKWLVTGYGHWNEPGEVRLWDVEAGTAKFEFKEPRGVRTTAFSPDGKYFVSGNFAGEVRFRSVATGEVVRELKEPSGSVERMHFTRDGKRLATASNGRGVRVWDVEGGTIVRSFEGHTGFVYWVEFSPDEKTLVTGSQDRTARLWDAESGALKRTLEHPNQVAAAVFSPDGRRLATACYDGRTRLWDVESGRELATMAAIGGSVHSVAFSPDGSFLAAGDQLGSVQLADAETLEQSAVLRGHQGNVFGLTFSRDGKTLVTTGWDKQVKLWTVETRQEEKSLVPPSDAAEPQSILALAWSPDHRTIAAALEDRTVRLYEPSGSVRHVLTGHKDAVAAVAFSPDGATLASAGYDQTVNLWNVETGDLERTLEGHTNWVFSVSFSPDGKRLASGGYDRTIRLWNPQTGKEQAVLEGHTAAVRSVAFSPDGRRIASGSSDRSVRVWDLTDEPASRALTGHNGTVRAVTFSPDGRTVASAGEDKAIKLWDVAAGTERRTLTGHQGMVWCLAFSPQGKTLASGGFDNAIKLWNPATGTEQQTLNGHTDIVTSLAFAPDTSELVSGSLDRTIKRWPSVSLLEALRPVTELTLVGHEGPNMSVAFSPDGRYALSAGDDASARLWDLRTGREVLKLTGHTSRVFDAQFSPDGSQIVTGSTDGSLRLWDRETGKELRRFGEGVMGGLVRSVAFSPDGKKIAAGGFHVVTMWSVDSGLRFFQTEGFFQEVADVAFSPDGRSILAAADYRQAQRYVRELDAQTGEIMRELAVHPGYINCVTYSPDGSRFATANYSGEVRLWDAKTGEMVQSFAGHQGPVEKVAFSPDGRTLVSGSSDKTVRMWNVATGDEVARYVSETHGTNHVAISPDGRYALCAGGHYPPQAGFTEGAWPHDGESRIRLLRLPQVDDTFLSEQEPAQVDVQGQLIVPVVVGRLRSPHGMQTHPFPGRKPAAVEFDLDGSHRSFHGAVAVNESVRTAGSGAPITFSIHGDGKLLWESRSLQRRSEGQDFALDVSGVKRLKLSAVTPWNTWAHAVWVEPRLSAHPLLSDAAARAEQTVKTDLSKLLGKEQVLLAEIVPDKIEVWGRFRASEQTVVVNGKDSPNGFWTHPFPGGIRGFARFNLEKHFEKFTGSVGINDMVAASRSQAPIIFRVLGNGEVLWTSKPLQDRGDSQPFEISVADVSKLEIEAKSDPSNYAHAVWVEPKLQPKRAPEKEEDEATESQK